MSGKEKSELLLELCKSQMKTLKLINKIMYETTKYQRTLSDTEQTKELLDLAWSTNDIISDNPKEQEIIDTIRKKFDIYL